MQRHAQLTARDIHGPYTQLLTNLQGDDGPAWLDALKRMNRKVNPWPAAPKPSKPNQVAALKYLIAMSRDGDEFLKKLLWLLIDGSEGLTKEVYITLKDSAEFPKGLIKEHASRGKSLVSCNCRTHLHEIFEAAGSKLRFSLHYGHYDSVESFNTDGMLAGWPGQEHEPKDAPLRYTFWLAEGLYGGHEGPLTEIVISKSDIDQIDLSKPGMYPGLENQ